MDKFSYKDFFVRAIAVVASVVLIVYFLPRENRFGYEYELNRPWKYGQLIASYDFPIAKTDTEIKTEQDSVLRQYQPYYLVDLAVESQMVKALRNDFYQGRMKGVPVSLLPRLTDLLHHIYGVGVLSGDDIEGLRRDGVTAVRTVIGTDATSRPVKDMYSIRSAYQHIMQADTVSFSREVLARCHINDYLEPNLKFDSLRSHAMYEDLLSMVSPASGLVQSGQKIIDRGEIVDQRTYNILRSLEQESLKRTDNTDGLWMTTAGQTVFVIIILVLFVTYLGMFRKDYYNAPNCMALLFSLITIFPVITSVMVERNLFSVYLVPYTIVAIFVRIFMDSRTAFITQAVTLILSSLSLHGPYEFLIVEMVGGLTAVYSLKELSQRSQLLRSAIVVTAVMVLSAFAFDLAQGLSPSALDRHFYTHLIVNGVLLLFAYPLMYLIERAFGFTSSVTLVELTNINNSLLRRMSKVAQGTFNHSMQVANLAAEVADKIGAKVQLVRTGAFYHDIGKMANPAFFTENQSGVNPHDAINDEAKSANIIISHVTDGLRMAEKYHLPKVIRDFIATHHGRSKVKYFYVQYVNKHPDVAVDDDLFTYPGPNPSTREQAILMMADAVEATSRSLKEFTDESIRALVNRIVDGQVAEGYFRNCPITFSDITKAKEVFVESLKTVYHTRISYPELRKPDPTPERTPRSALGGLFGSGRHNTWPRR